MVKALPPVACHPGRRCTDMVNRVAAIGGTRVNFVPTHYWLDGSNTGRVDAFCYMDRCAGVRWQGRRVLCGPVAHRVLGCAMREWNTQNP